MKRLIAAALVAVAATACSPPAEVPAPAEQAEPAPADRRQAAYRAGEEGPEPFVRALFARYDAASPLPAGETPPPGREPLYGRTLNAMIGADARKAGGEVPFLNFDPVCGCQDGEIVLQSVEIAETAVNQVDARVVFTRDGREVRQVMKLEREGPMWRVADVIPEGERPLTERLLEVIG
ncbi:DUF3828 domain-containing protein [Brevundimonas sp.]|jgi:hypothetical protein|uniref:DUF3828 domain-containing protein n=1 Tax=Brevundimonas sp. TaxID=1871086 RepID=UPI00391C5872